MQQDVPIFVCDGDCGSPTYAFLQRRWIFETNQWETRMVCGGCGHIQSKEYSDDLINGKVKPPVYVGYPGYIYDDNPDYELWKNLMKHDCRVGQGQHLVQIDNSFFKDYQTSKLNRMK